MTKKRNSKICRGRAPGRPLPLHPLPSPYQLLGLLSVVVVVGYRVGDLKLVGGKITPVKYYGSSSDRRQAVRHSPRIHEQMTDKKLCGLRSVPSLFRVFANGVHAAPQEWRRHYKETALLYGRVAGRLTWSVNARSLSSLG